MYAPWNSNTKISVAKKYLCEFLDSIKPMPNLEVALRCYGHTTFIRPNRNCKDSQLEVPFDKFFNNVAKIKDRIMALEPMGTTPIAYSLGESRKDFTPCHNCRNIIILITDGLEECDGNPCEVSAKLQQLGITLRPFIIGVGLNANFTDAFSCIGKFYDVSNEANFKDVLNLILTEALSQTTAEVDLLDINKKPSETDVNMTFFNSTSKAVVYNYLHTLNHLGNPDTLFLNPNNEYDLLIHTTPPVELKNITLTTGIHNKIKVNTPQGFLKVELDTKANFNTSVVISKINTFETINTQNLGKTEKYLTGFYDLEILTLPRIKLSKVEIVQSSLNTIKIPAPGYVYIAKGSIGFGSIYLDTGKSVTWVCNLENKFENEFLCLQPGKYKLVYRYANSKQTTQTIERNFNVQSNQTINVRLI